MRFRRIFILLIVMVVCAGQAWCANPPEWTQPFPPFKIAGNLYYVGSKDLASYLVATPQGLILINSSEVANVPLIRASIEKLGFKMHDVKILLISHAHSDHAAGSAELKRLTGAKYMVMAEDVPVVESGGKRDFRYGKEPAQLYPATKVDRVLHDGDTVRLGSAVLTAHLTPGHTKGCTTWTMKVSDGGRTYDVVIVGGTSVNKGYEFFGNAAYPNMAEDYKKTFAVLKALPCDIFLGAHGNYYDLLAKYPRLKAGGPNPFVDPDGYKQYVAAAEQNFLREYAKQSAAAHK
jgi:metallo-beta-lactamase class B